MSYALAIQLNPRRVDNFCLIEQGELLKVYQVQSAYKKYVFHRQVQWLISALKPSKLPALC